MQSTAGPLAIKAMAFAPILASSLPALSVAAGRFASIGASSVFTNEFSTSANAAKDPFPQVNRQHLVFCQLFPRSKMTKP